MRLVVRGIQQRGALEVLARLWQLPLPLKLQPSSDQRSALLPCLDARAPVCPRSACTVSRKGVELAAEFVGALCLILQSYVHA